MIYCTRVLITTSPLLNSVATSRSALAVIPAEKFISQKFNNENFNFKIL
jgi:hypothetical protein